ncbi:MAG: hypothetical protein ACLQGU_09730 [bacterium]
MPLYGSEYYWQFSDYVLICKQVFRDAASARACDIKKFQPFITAGKHGAGEILPLLQSEKGKGLTYT